MQTGTGRRASVRLWDSGGEALFSLASLSRDLVVSTRTASEDVGQRLHFRRDGYLDVSRTIDLPRKAGTTVAVVGLFEALPVRRADLIKRIRNQRSRMMKLMQGYAILCRGVGFNLFDVSGSGNYGNVGGSVKEGGNNGKGGRSSSREEARMSTPAGAVRLEQTLSSVMGSKFLGGMTRLSPVIDLGDAVRTDAKRRTGKPPVETPDGEVDGQTTTPRWRIEGLVSKPPSAVPTGALGKSNASNNVARELQFFSLNGRPIDLPPLSRALNDAWRKFESSAGMTSSSSRKSSRPACVLEVTLPNDMADVNLSPDKREAMLNEEPIICALLRAAVTEMWEGMSGGGSRSFRMDEVSKMSNRPPPAGRTAAAAATRASRVPAPVLPPADRSKNLLAASTETANRARKPPVTTAAASTESGGCDSAVPSTNGAGEGGPQMSLEARRLAHLRKLEQSQDGDVDSIGGDDENDITDHVRSDEARLVHTAALYRRASSPLVAVVEPPPGTIRRMRRRNAFVHAVNVSLETAGPDPSQAPVEARQADGCYDGNGKDGGGGFSPQTPTAVSAALVTPDEESRLQLSAGISPGMIYKADRERREELSQDQQSWEQTKLRFGMPDSGSQGDEIQKLTSILRAGDELGSRGLSDDNAESPAGLGEGEDGENDKLKKRGPRYTEIQGPEGYDNEPPKRKSLDHRTPPLSKRRRVKTNPAKGKRVDMLKAFAFGAASGGTTKEDTTDNSDSDSSSGDDGNDGVEKKLEVEGGAKRTSMTSPGEIGVLAIARSEDQPSSHGLANREDSAVELKRSPGAWNGSSSRIKNRMVRGALVIAGGNDGSGSSVLLDGPAEGRAEEAKAKTGARGGMNSSRKTEGVAGRDATAGSSTRTTPTSWDSSFRSTLDVVRMYRLGRMREDGLRNELLRTRVRRLKGSTSAGNLQLVPGESVGISGSQEGSSARKSKRKKVQEVVNLTKDDFHSMSVVGQFNLGFILARCKNNHLWILDQHACDEKFNFERLCDTTTVHEQTLLAPLPLELSPSEENCVLDNMEVFEANGFRFLYNETKPARHRLALTALPHSGSGGDGKKAVQFGPEDVGALCAMLGADGGASSGGYVAGSGTGADGSGIMGNNAVRRYASSGGSEAESSSSSALVRLPKAVAMFASRACRGSIMIGTALSQQEMETVIRKMVGVRAPWDCPHGRPTMRHVRDLTDKLEEDERRAAAHVAGPGLAVLSQGGLQASQDEEE